MVKYIISAKKWFDKVNGNTYHSVKVTDARTNKHLYTSGMEYGYGEQYRTTAKDWLVKTGRMKESDRYNREQNRKDLYFDESDVPRQRDLEEAYEEQKDFTKDNDDKFKKHLRNKR